LRLPRKNTDWAQDKGLYKVLGNQVELDIDIAHFTAKLASYNPDFDANEDNLGRNRELDYYCLRAAISGELVLSDFTKKCAESI
jgi:methylglutaconyl-CoA hydratase